MSITDDTLALVKAAQQRPDASIAKAFTQSGSAVSGLTAYDLEPAAKLLYPVITPLRNRIPRVSGRGGIQANWRAITGVNTGNAGIGISEGNRSVVQSTSTQDYTAAYKGIGLDDYVTYEAELAAEGFDDLRGRAVQGLLRGLMIGEEKAILGGNNSLALGTTPTPSVATATSGGTLAAATYNVYCVALTMDGWLAATIAGGLPLSGNRTLADGTSEAYNQGTAQKSAAASQVTTGSTSTVSASVTPVNGAVGYAWFWGVSGSELLGAITTINSVLITATATGTQNISAGFAADRSRCSQLYDGLFSQIMAAGSNAYVKTLATGTAGTGTTLTADTTGGIVEIDAALQSFWDQYRLSPTDIYVSSQEMVNITKKVLTSSSTSAQRFVFNSDQGMLAGGSMIRSYLNKFAMDGAKEIPIHLHPNIPPGTILFYTNEIPYPLSNVANVLQMRCRRDYYQIEWPFRTRKYEYGVYADEVLQCFFPPAFGVIRNIANG